MKKLLDALFVRKLMEKAGEPADAGTGAEPTPAQEPAAAEPKPAADPKTEADPKPAADDGKKSLLGGADKDGSAEPNPDGGKQPGDGKQDPQDTDPYEGLKLSNGAPVDAAEMANYKKMAKEMNLKAEDAQRILDFETQRLQAAQEQAAAAWKSETQQKYGDKLPTVLATAARAVQQFGGNELRDLLDQTGLGNHPVLIEAFNKAGALLKEDNSVPSNGAAPTDKTFSEALYGNHSN